MGRTVAQTAPKLTYDDFVLFPDDGKRHELIDGEHYVSPSPNVRHQAVLQNLNHLLHSFVREHGLGRVFFAPLDVVFTLHDVTEPDLIFVSNSRASIVTEANLQGAPDLVVEVLSPSSHRYDEVTKRALYERAEIGEYWIVDPEADTVKVYRREGEQFGRPALLSARDGDHLTSPLFPGLEIALADVLAE
ncbi:MAG TPA: Uma2 family endonuclease [Thermoanaerobaculia bacterium]|nr:Uma2 family endonuclease [Thermoanaerobaculia bacterium]